MSKNTFPTIQHYIWPITNAFSGFFTRTSALPRDRVCFYQHNLMHNWMTSPTSCEQLTLIHPDNRTSVQWGINQKSGHIDGASLQRGRGRWRACSKPLFDPKSKTKCTRVYRFNNSNYVLENRSPVMEKITMQKRIMNSNSHHFWTCSPSAHNSTLSLKVTF